MIVIYRFNNSNATIIIPSSKKMKKKKINVESVDRGHKTQHVKRKPNRQKSKTQRRHELPPHV